MKRCSEEVCLESHFTPHAPDASQQSKHSQQHQDEKQQAVASKESPGCLRQPFGEAGQQDSTAGTACHEGQHAVANSAERRVLTARLWRSQGIGRPGHYTPQIRYSMWSQVPALLQAPALNESPDTRESTVHHKALAMCPTTHACYYSINSGHIAQMV